MLKTFSKQNRNSSHNVVGLGWTSFFTDISSEMILNLVPLYLYNVLGAHTAVIGLIEGISEGTASMFKVLSGYLSDRIGKRKVITTLGYSLSTISKPFLSLANTWGAVLSIRFSDRVGKGIRTAARDALIADSVTKETRGVGFGLHRAMDTAGALIGLVIAAIVIAFTQAGSQSLTLRTFKIVAVLSLFPGIAGVVFLVKTVHEPQKTLRVKAERSNLQFRSFPKPFLVFLSILVVFSIGNSPDAFIILRAQERGLTVLQVMGMLISFNIVYVFASIPAGVLSDHHGRKKVLAFGWLLFSLIYLGFSQAQAAWQVWVCYALYGLYYGSTEGIVKAYVADLVLPDQRGTAYGVMNAIVGLTVLPASVIAGMLWEGIGSWKGFGPSAPFYFGSIAACVAVALLVFQSKHKTQRNRVRM